MIVEEMSKFLDREKKERRFGRKFMEINVKYCIDCGYENDTGMLVCSICKSNNFLDVEASKKLSMLVDMNKYGQLRVYYSSMMKKKKSAVRMNIRKVMLYLLCHHFNVCSVDDKKVEGVISKILSKKI